MITGARVETWGDEKLIPTGIRRNASFDENFAAVMAASSKYGPDRVFDKLRFLKGFRWTGHVPLRENCNCMICQLEKALFVEAYMRQWQGEPEPPRSKW